MNEPEKLIPPHGGYRKLKSFQMAQLAFDVTVRFCDRYIPKRSRTHDQMVQAARSRVHQSWPVKAWWSSDFFNASRAASLRS